MNSKNDRSLLDFRYEYMTIRAIPVTLYSDPHSAKLSSATEIILPCNSRLKISTDCHLGNQYLQCTLINDTEVSNLILKFEDESNDNKEDNKKNRQKNSKNVELNKVISKIKINLKLSDLSTHCIPVTP